jgi:hypothetical protein
MNKIYHGNFKEPKKFACGCREAYGSPESEYDLPKLFIVPCCNHTTMPCVNKDCDICKDKSIKCPRCGFVSYNSNDVKHKYCGKCHEWHEFMTDL